RECHVAGTRDRFAAAGEAGAACLLRAWPLTRGGPLGYSVQIDTVALLDAGPGGVAAGYLEDPFRRTTDRPRGQRQRRRVRVDADDRLVGADEDHVERD